MLRIRRFIRADLCPSVGMSRSILLSALGWAVQQTLLDFTGTKAQKVTPVML